jgi:hypothetical protein
MGNITAFLCVIIMFDWYLQKTLQITHNSLRGSGKYSYFLADNFSGKEILSFSMTVQILSYRGMVQIVDI